jgi:RNA polymerase sigma-70 factor, ECF subfamily
VNEPLWDAADLTAHSGAASEPAEKTDRQLVERTLAGDTEAFAHLHKRYYARVYRLALFRTRNAQDAEDIASETFLRAIAHLPSYRFQGESLFPWLSRIATNLVTDMGRRGAGVTLVSLDASTSDGVRTLIEGLRGDGPDPRELAERHETQAFLRAAVAALPHDQGDAILMRFLGDMPLKEIGAAMGRTEGAIKSLLHRGLVNLRRALVQQEEQAERFGQTRAQANRQNTTSSTTGQTQRMFDTGGPGKRD